MRSASFARAERARAPVPTLVRELRTITAGEVRAIEIAGRPFFIATLFQPQLSAKAAEHPVFEAFLRAAAKADSQAARA